MTSTNLQELSGWQSCTALLNGQVCASGLGNAVYSMAGPVMLPSLDDNASQFQISGSTPYSNALWWKQIAPNNDAHNFLYDLWFYLTEPANSQSLEFDVNQSIGNVGKWFVFGTQCNFKDSHMWDVWDGANEKWYPTEVPCPPVSASTWHHLVLEFERTDPAVVKFLSVTLDDVKSEFNQSFTTSRTSNVDAIKVAFQMDGDGSEQPYSVWVDKMMLTYW